MLVSRELVKIRNKMVCIDGQVGIRCDEIGRGEGSEGRVDGGDEK